MNLCGVVPTNPGIHNCKTSAMSHFKFAVYWAWGISRERKQSETWPISQVGCLCNCLPSETHLSLQTDAADFPPGCQQHWKPLPDLFIAVETSGEEGKGRAFAPPSALALPFPESTAELSLDKTDSQRTEERQGLLLDYTQTSVPKQATSRFL